MLVIGSRGSKLALWQANHIKDRLTVLGNETRIDVFQTSGDRFQSGPLKEVGNKGLFTKEIEEALLDGRVDVAVHSLKDMPAQLPERLVIAAVPEREDPRDALIGAKLADLPEGARVGTGSLRRVALLKAARPDLRPEPMRGNVDTRLRKLDEGQFDAIVLAAAGLRRLGWEHRIAEMLPVEVMCPAPGQGALAIETRNGGVARDVCRRLNDATSEARVTAERAVLQVLGAGCQVPVGAHARVEGSRLHLIALVTTLDGAVMVKRELEGGVDEAHEIGTRCGTELLENGAGDILASVYRS